MLTWQGAAKQGGAALVLALTLSLLAGCSAPKTHPVEGKVVFEKGDLKKLAGCAVDFQDPSDPNLRAFGVIKEDGSFSLQTNYKGKRYPGAFEGTYQGKIVVQTESGSDEEKLFNQLKLDARYLNVKTSGLTLTVPPSGPVTLKVQRVKPGVKQVNPFTPVVTDC